MNLIETITYLALASILIVSFFQSFLPLAALQGSLDRRIDTSYELLIGAI